jgi:hypothetical protein
MAGKIYIVSTLLFTRLSSFSLFSLNNITFILFLQFEWYDRDRVIYPKYLIKASLQIFLNALDRGRIVKLKGFQEFLFIEAGSFK